MNHLIELLPYASTAPVSNDTMCTRTQRGNQDHGLNISTVSLKEAVGMLFIGFGCLGSTVENRMGFEKVRDIVV